MAKTAENTILEKKTCIYSKELPSFHTTCEFDSLSKKVKERRWKGVTWKSILSAISNRQSYTLAAAFWTRNHVEPLITTHLCTTKNEEGKDLRKMSLLPSNWSNCSINSHSLNLSHIYKDDFQGICSLCYLRLIVLCNSIASKITSTYHVWESQIIYSKRQFTYDQNVRPIQGLC